MGNILIHARHSYSWEVAQVTLEFEIEKFSACISFIFPVQPRKRPALAKPKGPTHVALEYVCSGPGIPRLPSAWPGGMELGETVVAGRWTFEKTLS